MFAFGARRSGTYWLQRVLAVHPKVAEVPSETHLFSHGILPLLERFHHGTRSSSRVGTLYVPRETLIDATRDFCDTVLGGFREPHCTLLVERTPVHADCAELIGEIYPDGRLIHIIRDGRDVARSLLSQRWGPTGIAEAACEWRSSVLAGRAASNHRGYIEIRYEDLLGDPEGSLTDLYRTLGLPITPEVVDAALRAIARRVNLHPGRTGAAAEERRCVLLPAEVREFERIAGDLLGELGYPVAVKQRRPPSTGPRARLAALERRFRGTLAWRRGAPPPASGASERPAALLDRLLTFVAAGSAERARELLTEDAVLLLRDDDEAIELSGKEAADRLVVELARDPALRAPQVRGEVFPGRPTAACLLTYELEDGVRAERVLLGSAAGGRLNRVALLRLPPHPPRG